MSQYPEHKLLDSQWNAVMLLIRRLGFDPNEFERETTVGTAPPTKVVPQLVHRPTGFKFTFDYNQDRKSHAVWYTPGDDSPSNSARELDWPSALYWVEIWLENVRRELSAPNLWDVLEQSRELLAAYEEAGDGDTGNAPFTPEEQAQIAVQLDGMKQLLVSTYGADPAALEGRFEELVEASKKMGRREWLFMFMGVGLHWTLTGLIPPEGLRGMLALAGQGIGHLFGGGMPQLPMP